MDPIEVLPSQLIIGTKRIQGWLAEIPTDAEDTLRFRGNDRRPPNDRKIPARECRRKGWQPIGEGGVFIPKTRSSSLCPLSRRSSDLNLSVIAACCCLMVFVLNARIVMSPDSKSTSDHLRLNISPLPIPVSSAQIMIPRK